MSEILEHARVIALYRYPVKSMLGEALRSLDLDERGVVDDRRWSVRTADGKIGSGKNTRRFAAVPGLLDLRATMQDSCAVVEFPDGRRLFVGDPELADAVSAHVDAPVHIDEETSVSHFDDGPVSLVGTASVDAVSGAQGALVDPARFRPNLLLATAEPFAEDDWVGRRLHVGTAALELVMPSVRCVMVDMQTAELPPQHGNLLAIGRLNAAYLGVIAKVLTAGVVSLGDSATVQ